MPANASWVERILRAADHAHAHLDEEISPEALASVAELSLHHFHRVFRGVTGESVMGYVRRLRLERAAQRLKHGARPVTDIAMASGYGSHEAFTRAFQARFGQSPSAYRERARVALEREAPIVLRDEAERVGVAMRHTGHYLTCGATWSALTALAERSGFLRRTLASIGLVYDDPDVTPTEYLRYDACLVLERVAEDALLPEGVRRRVIPGGRYAVALHHGPFDTLPETYLRLIGHWLPHRGLELADEPVLETYLTEPDDTAPADMRTEVSVRIA